jgi:hypothetical protein
MDKRIFYLYIFSKLWNGENNMRNIFFAALAIAIASVGSALAGRELEGIACRSVHLQFPGSGTAFYNEVEVQKSAEGSYFMVCGWDKGYFGMQELYDGRKVVIFSVWDSGQDNPNAVDEEQRTKTVHKHPDVQIGRFGGEGTGGQSFYNFDWQIGENYRFMLRSASAGGRTVYSGYFYHPGQAEWLHLVSFSTIHGREQMSGFYSFVEDFRRNRVSTTKERRAVFGNAWLLDSQGTWKYLDAARFTADSNPVMNIDGGSSGDRFYLATGGDIENSGTKLWDHIRVPPAGEKKAPLDLP